MDHGRKLGIEKITGNSWCVGIPLLIKNRTKDVAEIDARILPAVRTFRTIEILYICMELTYDRVAGKRPAPVKSDRKNGFCSPWAALRAVASKKFHLEKVRYARGVCKKPPISGHSGAG